MIKVFDSTCCSLGECPLWHPMRQTLFWFDINQKRLFERGLKDIKAHQWLFEEYVSAAGWVSANELLIASESALFIFDLAKGKREHLCSLEADNANNRSNDGRADPHGGFWIGTMGKKSEKCAGAIYRYYRGELRQLYKNITIANSICFSPSGDLAYFCDTPMQQIMQVKLDSRGWPDGEPEIFTDLRAEGCNPDGSVVDAEGKLWNAQWGAYSVACYKPDGEFEHAIEFEASQISCPAFGGEDFNTLFVTSASENLDDPCSENAGKVFAASCDSKGQVEHKVIAA